MSPQLLRFGSFARVFIGLVFIGLVSSCDKNPEDPNNTDATEAAEPEVPESNGIELGDNRFVIEVGENSLAGTKAQATDDGMGLAIGMHIDEQSYFMLQRPLMTEQTGRFFDPETVNLHLQDQGKECVFGSSLASIARMTTGRAPSFEGAITEHDTDHVAGYFEGTLWCNTSNPKDPDPIHVKGAFDVPIEKSEPDSRAVAKDTPFDETNLNAIAEALRGAWVLPVAASNPNQDGKSAWNIDSYVLVTFDGNKEKRAVLQIVAPCRFDINYGTEDNPGWTHTTFAAGDNKLFVGPGNAGVFTEEGAVVCTDQKIYELTDDGCTAWSSQKLGDWSKAEADCSLSDGTFRAGSIRLDTVDGMLMDANMTQNEAASFDDFDQAKTSL